MDTPMSLINERVSELCGLMADMRKETTEIRANLACVKTDIAWLKRSFWWAAGIASTALAGGVASVLLRCK